jgi:large subunit ribosomal protein L25
MSDQLELAAETRDRVGKGASRALRRDGRVPAVIYGQNQAPQAIHLEEKALTKALMTGHFMNSVILVGGARTVAKDVTLHPVTDRPVHVDFLRVSEHAQITVAVPVVFTDQEQSPGLKAGGVLNIVRHELELVVDAAEIPSEIQVSVAGLELGESVHISAVTLPAGAKPAIEDRDFTIATLGAPSALRSEGAGAETPALEQASQDAANA